ncbi:spore germination protein GerPE [Metabacillus litoralis]|uniref:Spore germination protein GerPE n=1 Tax=Metabacillus litoralis TaxID=152268 RepID=A0A5C6VVU8_9BACI|nr:spore germination protein GerPE [Metabacillus litoralis]TXC89656.1 spore germination protein GerPE [Metabacillus litoralis]
MISRYSQVTSAYVNTIGISSVFNIGDSQQITPTAKVLAIQREEERFLGDEGDLSEYPIFEEEIPQPQFYEEVVTNFFHENPRIRVSNVKVIAISSSSVFQIGSTKDIICETRVKNIRQLKK